MSSSFFSLPFLLYFLFFISMINGQNLIYDTCKTSSKQDPNVNLQFCTTSLQAAPASHCANLEGLGMMSIRLTRYNVTDTRCYIKQLLKNNTKIDPYVKSCLNDCFELYSDAIPGIKNAMKSYSSKHYFDANVQISSVMDATTTCEDGFKQKKGVVSPLTKRNRATFELSAIALSIMNIIQRGSN
ncbi:putative invertase inhibitor [Rutidosis leptorrhynchoides]|uniref:putative invertase inhibitor n=1 Tax=Rutidosis leptorrhynchoides TaxID=125765 RepID=UPI003A998502